jgi:hypothetical protein
MREWPLAWPDTRPPRISSVRSSSQSTVAVPILRLKLTSAEMPVVGSPFWIS